ncbi:MAG: hypothetical protein NZ556_07815 [Fimbriimonadales bacterium]|nr:hypothetical protein [Fimbriimonadales bacterium]
MDPILQVISISGTAIALSFGLARIILRQQEQFMREQIALTKSLFEQLDKRLLRLEQVIDELNDGIMQLRFPAARSKE